MIIGVLTLLGAIFGVTSGVTDMGSYFHDHPVGQLQPGSNAWKAACKDAFPNSFDPDSGWWVDMHGRHHPCVIKIIHRW